MLSSLRIFWPAEYCGFLVRNLGFIQSILFRNQAYGIIFRLVFRALNLIILLTFARWTEHCGINSDPEIYYWISILQTSNIESRSGV